MDLYSKLYQVPASVLQMSNTYQKYEFAVINGKRFGFQKSRTSTSSLAIATWDNSLFGGSSSPLTPNLFVTTTFSRAVQINFFCKSFVEINEENKIHLLVSLSWLKPHPKSAELGKPTTAWFYDLFELYGVHSLIPVQFLQPRAVSLIENFNNEPVLFVCPCIDFESFETNYCIVLFVSFRVLSYCMKITLIIIMQTQSFWKTFRSEIHI